MLAQSFHSRQGKAYLFNAVINVLEGPKEERLMTTGSTQTSIPSDGIFPIIYGIYCYVPSYPKCHPC